MREIERALSPPASDKGLVLGYAYANRLISLCVMFLLYAKQLALSIRNQWHNVDTYKKTNPRRYI